MMSLAAAFPFPSFLPPLADLFALEFFARRRSPSHCSDVAGRVSIGITITYATLWFERTLMLRCFSTVAATVLASVTDRIP
jgi:hypothetical protein